MYIKIKFPPLIVRDFLCTLRDRLAEEDRVYSTLRRR